MAGLVKIIAIFLIIYLIFRFFFMYLFPSILRWLVYRQKKKYYGNTKSGGSSSDNQQKTKVRFNYSRSSSNGQTTDKIGEYVDFEEIKDDKDKNKEKES